MPTTERKRICKTGGVLGLKLRKALNAEGTAKAIATVDGEGIPNLSFSSHLRADENGDLVHLEFLESSRTSKNLVNAIWFDKGVSISIRDKKGNEWSVSGKAVKAHICGPLFRKHYEELRAELGDVDLSAVWVIRPERVREETLAARLAEQDETHPFYRHLDRLAKSRRATSSSRHIGKNAKKKEIV